ncbi:MAG: hypothetical protein IPN21_18390 [Burkholderiales bacterium]|nr:hypothetical protein [Burkholderiales bacterium]
MTDITKTIEDGINALQSKLGAELKSAIEKFEGQLNEKGNVATEAKDAVRVLSEKFDQQMTELAQKMETAKGGEVSALSAGDAFVKSDEFKALIERKPHGPRGSEEHRSEHQHHHQLPADEPRHCPWRVQAIDHS